MGWFDRLLGRKPPTSQKSVSEEQLVPANWTSSQPHLALLEKFLSAREVNSSFLEWWAPAFGMNPQRAIDGLVAHGALELAPTVADLKMMLSSRGLKVSGKKAELIQRLLEADPKGMDVPYAPRMILRCTPAASEAVSRWKAEQARVFEMASDSVLAALRNRYFEEAIRTADAYRKNKFKTPLPPGAAAMIITPAPRSIKERANDLARVFTARPKVLNGQVPELQPEQWEGLYLNYAIGELLGRTVPEKCIPGLTKDGEYGDDEEDDREIAGLTKGLVVEITRWLHNKAWEETSHERRGSLGITHAIWMYPNAPCMINPSHPTEADIRQDSAHRAANGKRYEIAKGLLIDGKWTWPGVEFGCKCVSRSVLPWTPPGDAKPRAAMVLWDREWAEQGNALAQYNLGLDSSTGRGVPQDYEEAYFWFDLAATGKPQAALTKLAVKARAEAASHLSPADLSRAQERARKWVECHPPKLYAPEEE
jgi:hypothetical protein